MKKSDKKLMQKFYLGKPAIIIKNDYLYIGEISKIENKDEYKISLQITKTNIIRDDNQEIKHLWQNNTYPINISITEKNYNLKYIDADDYTIIFFDDEQNIENIINEHINNDIIKYINNKKNINKTLVERLKKYALKDLKDKTEFENKL